MNYKIKAGQEALLALNEAVRIAQQHTDDTTLAHALAALCRLLADASPVITLALTLDDVFVFTVPCP